MVSAAVRGVGRVVSIGAVVNRPVASPSNALVVPISGMDCNFTTNNSSLPAGGRGGSYFNNNDNTNIAVRPITFLAICRNSMELISISERRNATSGLIGVVPSILGGMGKIFGGSGDRSTSSFSRVARSSVSN